MKARTRLLIFSPGTVAGKSCLRKGVQVCSPMKRSNKMLAFCQPRRVGRMVDFVSRKLQNGKTFKMLLAQDHSGDWRTDFMEKISKESFSFEGRKCFSQSKYPQKSHITSPPRRLLLPRKLTFLPKRIPNNRLLFQDCY